MTAEMRTCGACGQRALCDHDQDSGSWLCDRCNAPPPEPPPGDVMPLFTPAPPVMPGQLELPRAA